jgi:hypothetical protein
MLRLSHWSGSKLPPPTIEWFQRFEEIRNLDLAKVRLYDGSSWLPRSVGAITLSLPLLAWLFGWTRIYFNRDRRSRRPVCNPNTSQGIELLAEELYHAKQQLERGAASFYAAYLWEYFQHRRRGLRKFEAYSAISFEREAKAFARTAAMQARASREADDSHRCEQRRVNS